MMNNLEASLEALNKEQYDQKLDRKNQEKR